MCIKRQQEQAACASLAWFWQGSRLLLNLTFCFSSIKYLWGRIFQTWQGTRQIKMTKTIDRPLRVFPRSCLTYIRARPRLVRNAIPRSIDNRPTSSTAHPSTSISKSFRATTYLKTKAIHSCKSLPRTLYIVRLFRVVCAYECSLYVCWSTRWMTSTASSTYVLLGICPFYQWWM